MKFQLEQQDLFDIIREHLADRGVEIPSDAAHEFITDPDGGIKVEITGLSFASLLSSRQSVPSPRRQSQTPQQPQQMEDDVDDEGAQNGPTSWDDPTVVPDRPPPARDKPEQVELQRTAPGRKIRSTPRYSIQDAGAPAIPEAPYQNQHTSRDATRVPPRPSAVNPRVQRVDAKVLVAEDISQFKDPSNMDDEIS